MSTVKRALGSPAFFCLALLLWPISSHASSNQLLYVQAGPSLVTYSVNPSTAKATKLGSLHLSASDKYPIQIFHSPTSPYIYILGFASATKQYIWVHATTAEGVPTVSPVQQLQVKPALTQFFIHPNGTFAYALYSWTNQNGEFVGDIVLFTISPKTGQLTNTTKAVANFPANYYWQTFLYGFDSAGSKFYTRAYVDFRDSNGNDFYFYAVNAKTGALSSGTLFWQDDGANQGSDFSVIGESLIGEDFDFQQCCSYGGISLYQNSLKAIGSKPLIACTSTMLAVCGDYSIMAFHPSGKYLFVTDYTTNEVSILYISLPLKKLESSGAFIPGSPTTVAFSPDGLLVYAVENSEILVYVFNPHSGLLTASTSIAAPGVGHILPVK